jgi:hypothetical protein
MVTRHQEQLPGGSEVTQGRHRIFCSVWAILSPAVDCVSGTAIEVISELRRSCFAASGGS